MIRVPIHRYKDYRSYLRDLIQSYPKKGYGLVGKIAAAIHVQTSLLSQVFSGSRDLTLEQGIAVTHFFGLNNSEQKYFLVLLNLARAGSPQLKSYYESELSLLATQFDKVSSRVKKSASAMSDLDQATYYSDGIFVSIWLMTGIPEYQTPSAISAKTNIPLRKVKEVLDFLIQTGLCIEKNGKVQIAVTHTHVPENSRWINRHHTNWRLSALQHLGNLKEDELAFSAPLTVSKKDFLQIKRILLTAIEKISTVVKDSPSEELACINLDFFRIY